MAQLPFNSRFTKNEVITTNGIRTYGIAHDYSFLDVNNLLDENIISFKVDNIHQGRPDRIAEEVYGAISLEWVITMSQKPLNTLNWPKTGDVLRLPAGHLISGYI